MNKKFILGFLASLVGFAALSWLGGYNFDERSPMVAWMAFNAVGLSAVVGMLVKGDH